MVAATVAALALSTPVSSLRAHLNKLAATITTTADSFPNVPDETFARQASPRLDALVKFEHQAIPRFRSTLHTYGSLRDARNAVDQIDLAASMLDESLTANTVPKRAVFFFNAKLCLALALHYTNDARFWLALVAPPKK